MPEPPSSAPPPVTCRSPLHMMPQTFSVPSCRTTSAEAGSRMPDSKSAAVTPLRITFVTPEGIS